MRIERKEPLESPPPDRSWLTTESITDSGFGPSYKTATKVGIVVAWVIIFTIIVCGIAICGAVVLLFIKLLSLLMIGI